MPIHKSQNWNYEMFIFQLNCEILFCNFFCYLVGSHGVFLSATAYDPCLKAVQCDGSGLSGQPTCCVNLQACSGCSCLCLCICAVSVFELEWHMELAVWEFHNSDDKPSSDRRQWHAHDCTVFWSSNVLLSHWMSSSERQHLHASALVCNDEFASSKLCTLLNQYRYALHLPQSQKGRGRTVTQTNQTLHAIFTAAFETLMQFVITMWNGNAQPKLNPLYTLYWHRYLPEVEYKSMDCPTALFVLP